MACNTLPYKIAALRDAHQLFLSTAKAAIATAFGGAWFQKRAHAQASGSPTAVEFPDSTVLPTPTPPFAGFIEPNLVPRVSHTAG